MLGRNKMKNLRGCLVLAAVLMAGIVAAGCSAATPQASSFADPFAYCAAIRTIDSPDARYTGARVPDSIIQGFKQAAGLQASTEPSDIFKQATIWRCMDGKVYACNFGANLQCDSKADTNSTPTEAMAEYCTANPGSDFVPMSVTGHATVYSWRCVLGKPQVNEQIAKVDAKGYLAQIWYPIEPNP